MRWIVIAVLAVIVVAAAPGRAFAAEPPFKPTPSVGILLTDGELIEALAAEPAPFDMVRITMPDGATRYLAPVRIRAVFDESREDRTRALLDERETIGTPLPPPPSPPAQKRVLRVGPRSVTRSFLITETTLLGRVDSRRSSRHDLDGHFALDVGTMTNVGTNTALGGTIFVGAANDYVNAGARLRLRRWISRTSSIDVAPGIIPLERQVEGGKALPPGFSLQLSVNPSRYFSLTTEVFTVRRRNYRHDGIRVTSSEDVRDTGLMVGGRFGQWPGAVAGGATVLAVLLLSSFHGSKY